MPRKTKPTKVFREEIHYPEGSPNARFNSTRQTFDEGQFNDWREYAAKYDETNERESLFFVGEIAWERV